MTKVYIIKYAFIFDIIAESDELWYNKKNFKVPYKASFKGSAYLINTTATAGKNGREHE